MNDPQKRGPLYALSESSPVRLGLAFALVACALWVVRSIHEVEQRVSERAVPRDLFTARMDAISEDIADLKTQTGRDVADLKAQVRSIEQRLYASGK